jgi:hypothetical protein
MSGFATMTDFSRISDAYSYLGHSFLSGNVEVAKLLYGNAWKESPPLIKTIEQLQYCLTAAEIEKDTTGIYGNEFLYYWGMICIGEVSRLIFKDLETAEICFRKILKTVPEAEARLAFIDLLTTNEPCKNESNVEKLDILRKWAGKQDFFSMIVLSKIVYYAFWDEEQTDNRELPMRALRLLELPCQKGHPVAIKFYNAMLDTIGTPAALRIKMDVSHMNTDVLYDA